MGIFSRPASRGSEGSPGRRGWLRRMVMPTGRPDPETEEIKRAAAEDVAAMEAEDRKYFKRDGPGEIEDDL